MGYKAVIFDLDGTLVDTLQDIAFTINQALRDQGFPEHNVEEYRNFVGWGLWEACHLALPVTQNSNEIIRICAEYVHKLYRETPVLYSQPYPGISEVLEDLAQRDIPMAILSNKDHHVTVKVVFHLLNEKFFSSVQGAVPEFPKKPDPQLALRVARKWGLEPRKILFVGDTEVDIQTAQAAGMDALAVCWGFRKVEELKSAGVCQWAEHPRDILRYF